MGAMPFLIFSKSDFYDINWDLILKYGLNLKLFQPFCDSIMLQKHFQWQSYASLGYKGHPDFKMSY